MEINQYIYVLAFCLTMCSLAFLSGFAYSGNRVLATDSPNYKSIKHIHNTVSGFFLLWALLFCNYIPFFVLVPNTGESALYYYGILYYVDMFFWLPSVFYLAQAIFQYSYNRYIWLPLTTFPILGCLVWFLYNPSLDTVLYSFGLLMVGFAIFAFCYSLSYRRYRRILKSEYSELSRRDVRWTVYAYIGLVVQLVFFLLDILFFSLWVSILYDLATLFNAVFITYFAKRMLPVANIDEIANLAIDNELNNYNKHLADIEINAAAPEGKDEVNYGSSLNLDMIQERLESYCEAKKLFLNPQLSRDILCRNIGVNKNYLAQYFHLKDISYYQYINTLRIHYACELLSQSDNKLSIKEIAEKAGYISYRSFYNSFCEVMNCKPSDYLQKR